MRLRTNLIGAYLLVALVPLVAIVWVNDESTKDMLIQERLTTLEAIAEARISAIQDYFYTWEQTIGVIQDNPVIKTNLETVIEYRFQPDDPHFQLAVKSVDMQLRSWKTGFDDVHDVLLLTQQGEIVYRREQSQKHELGKILFDPTETVIENTGQRIYISDLFLDVDQNVKFFVGAPLSNSDSTLIGMIVFEVDAYKLYALIQDTTGLGETGETVIARLEKNEESNQDKQALGVQSRDEALFLNPLRFDLEAAFLRTQVNSSQEYTPIQHAVLGKNGYGPSFDYRGEFVLAVWRYLPRQNWGLVTKIDYAEVLEPALQLRRTTIWLVSIVTSIILLYSWIVSGFTSRFVKEIEVAKNKSEAILSSIGDAVFVVDNEALIVQLNRAATTFIDKGEKEVLGKYAYDVFSIVSENGDPLLKNILERGLTTGTSQNIGLHTFFKKQNGKLMLVSGTVSPLVDQKGRVIGVVCVLRDESKTQEVDRLKTEFVSLASHQLRTPLTGIKWATELLLNQKKGFTKKQIDYIHRIHESEEHMVDLVNGLLNVTRLESGALIINPEPIDVGQFLKSLSQDFHLVAQKDFIHFETHVPDDPVVLPMDKDVLGLSIHNLVSNAIKYTKKKGHVFLQLEADEQEIRIKITDTGIGIPTEQKKSIFEKFFRADNAIVLAIAGTGLGLYVTKELTQQAGGTISFESTMGKGSTFTVTFPRIGMRAKKGTKQPEHELLLS